LTQHLYTDGGTIGPNPSPLGGTWCWCLIEEEHMLSWDCGIMTPKNLELPNATNNVMELYAAVRGLFSVPRDWKGMLYTESNITIGRLYSSWRCKGCPTWLRERVRKIKLWNKPILLGGHPTKIELAQGKRRDGKLVSKWNVFCDERCSELSRDFQRRLT
jgi:ribonuclease HI